MERDRAETERAHRVLVVDDHPDTTEVLSVLFEILGCEPRTAARGREALSVARDFDPGLVVLDIGLPDINGFEVIHALRGDTKFEQRCIVAVSGWTRPDDVLHAMQVGFDDYFVKPIDLSIVRQILRVAEARARAAPSKEASSSAHGCRARRRMRRVTKRNRIHA